MEIMYSRMTWGWTSVEWSNILDYWKVPILTGGTVVEVLCYKSEGRWFDPRWCHWNFSLT